jgi:hypothetical protein
VRVFLAIAASVLVAAPAATATTQEQEKLRKSESVVRFFTGTKHGWMRAPNQEQCIAVPWASTCWIARQKLSFHQGRVERLQRILWRTFPWTNDWRTSVRLSQRAYPGTDDWLLFISAREGGWGRFVMNHQGSGAGGWLQFMASTFYAYVDDARRDIARRGFVVPERVWTWTHPLGQALTGAYMRYTGRDGCHWCL